MRVNKDLILKRIEEIEDSVNFLKKYIHVPETEFIKERKTIDATKYLVIKAFEAASSICNQLCSKII